MTIHDEIRDEKDNIILTEKQKKYQIRLINTDVLQVNKYYLLIKEES